MCGHNSEAAGAFAGGHRRPRTARGFRLQTLVLVTDASGDSEFSDPYDRRREEEVRVDVATPDGEPVEGTHGYDFDADCAVDAEAPEFFAGAYDLLVVPGGRSPGRLRIAAPEAADVASAVDEAGLPGAAICHGAHLPISACGPDGREAAASWSPADDVENAGGAFRDGELVVDDTLVTSRVREDLAAFPRAIVDPIEER